MKKILMILFVISANITFPQSADLILNTNVSQEYVDYLYGELAVCNQTISNPISVPVTLNAYAKRFFINISLIHCDIAVTLDNEKTILDSIRANNKRLEDFYVANIGSLNIDDSKIFFNQLLELFKDPKYGQLKSQIENMTASYLYSLMSLAYYTQSLYDSVYTRMKSIRQDFDILVHNTAMFNVSLRLQGSATDEVMVFSQNHFKTAGAVDSLAKKASDSFRNALKQFADVQNGNIPPAEMINSLKASFTYFSAGLDSVYLMINSEPLSLLKLNSDWITKANEFIAELTDMLNGKTYYTGSDNIKIRPVALLENPVNKWPGILLNFYRSGNRYTYTFANLFPEALPASVVEKLKEDMILNSTDSNQELYSRMKELKINYLNMLRNGQDNSSVNFGTAFVQSFIFMNDLTVETENFIHYIKAGDYRTGYPFSTFNNKALTDSISNYFNAACGDRGLLFTILIVNEKQNQPYYIGAETDFTPVYITNSMALNIRDKSRKISYMIKDIWDYVGNIYGEMDKMFDMSLDPNYLNFTGVKSPLDIILVLEGSNPDFLDITPYGITKMKDMGMQLRQMFGKYADDMNNMTVFMDSLNIYRSEFNLNDQGMLWLMFGLNSFVQTVNTDFQVPDSTTIIDGTKVNLSAWFDNPPQDLLVKFKWYFDNDPATDNSLGGLFPEGRTEKTGKGNTEIPTRFLLSQNYPNPFNPTTKIEYSVPQTGYVILKVFDVLGKEIATLVSAEKSAGNYTVELNADGLTSGIYFYRMTAGGFVDTKKLVVLK